MTTQKSVVVCAFLAVIVWRAHGKPAASSASESPLVLIVSFDGFRWDYQQKTDTPNFDKLGAAGVRARYIKDVFITKTFPNHFTLVTGLFEDSHGVVGNAMYDPLLNATFSMSSKDPEWWNGGEPVWITNQKQGGRSSVIFWPSFNVNFSGIVPDFYFPEYNTSVPFRHRIDATIDNFVNGKVNFGALYFHEPDHSGHLFGPDNPLLLPVIRMCDDTMGYLVQRLKETGLYDRMNLIVTSDHGMASISPNRVIVVEDYVDPNLYPFRTISNNPILSIWPENEADTQAIYECLHSKNPHMTVYLKEDIPRIYHYHDNRRISPILIVGHEGWQIHSNKTKTWPTHLGTHGYNNSLMVMHPFFLAHGPAFKQGYISPPFSSTNVYELMCHILGIAPAPNNGSLDSVMALLADQPGSKAVGGGEGTVMPDSGGGGGVSKVTIFGVSISVGLVVLVASLLAAMCLKQRTYRAKPMSYAPIPDTSMEKETEEPFLPNSRL